MKILHINGTDEGGTYNLLFDIHKALIKKKLKQRFIFLKKKKNTNFCYQENIFFYIHFYIINFLKRS